MIAVQLASEWTRSCVCRAPSSSAYTIFGGIRNDRPHLSSAMYGLCIHDQISLALGDEGVNSTVCVNPQCKATASNPIYSPSGNLLAYLYALSCSYGNSCIRREMQRPGYESDRNHIIVVDLTGTKPPIDTSKAQ